MKKGWILLVCLLTVLQMNFISADNKEVILFSAQWCGPCKAFHPIFDQVASERNDITFHSEDVDSSPLADKYKIESMPTVVILKDGKEVKRITGYKSKADFISVLDQSFGK